MKVLFIPSQVQFEASEDMTIMQAAIEAGIEIDAPCGGRGLCGKCKVKIVESGQAKTVLACKTPLSDGMVIDTSSLKNKNHRILTTGISREVEIAPLVKAVSVRVTKASMRDLRSCWSRIKDELPTGAFLTNSAAVSKLYKVIDSNGDVDVILCGMEVIGVVPHGSNIYAAAVDIGTTTIACYLLDLKSGEQLAHASMLNPQVAYGADVIQRIKYSLENGSDELTEAVRNAVDELIKEAADKAKVLTNEIYFISAVGNTCMHHLLAGISPDSLAYAPYTATLSEVLITDAALFGFNVYPAAKLMLLPNIAGFVGADTVGAAIAGNMDQLEDLTLMIDIGTNGEMVLGNREKLAGCSTAAGPAFEGAVISCGMRGADGAIDHVSITENGLEYTVIGEIAPIGICGSGLIDLTAELVRTKIIDETGRLQSADEVDSRYAKYIVEENGTKGFLLADELHSGNGSKIVFTQKDIREIQLAKGAMAAGIKMLARRLGVDISDFKRVFIAGAFGSYMSPASACGIGLIPPELKDVVEAVGNAAGEGAKIAALSEQEIEHAKSIAENIDYVELASDAAFQDIFVDELEFPV